MKSYDDDTGLPLHSIVILWPNFACVNALETGLVNSNGLILLSLQWNHLVINHPAPTKIHSSPLMYHHMIFHASDSAISDYWNCMYISMVIIQMSVWNAILSYSLDAVKKEVCLVLYF